jgi:predicted  nucleic acid-binding Zn-ribbon protein
MQYYSRATAAGTLALALAIVGCNRPAAETRTASTTAAVTGDRVADERRAHTDDITTLDQRVANLEQEYTKTSQKVVNKSKTPTAGLREEVKEDVANVKNAVAGLQTTTPENWWDRHEQAMSRTADDIESDVRRLAGGKLAVRPEATTGKTDEGVSTAPFTSRRDAFVGNLQERVEAMENALKNIKARGAVDTELDDTRARIKKLREDLDHLRSADADDWWDISKSRVTDYVDRVEASVKRLDDDSR